MHADLFRFKFDQAGGGLIICARFGLLQELFENEAMAVPRSRPIILGDFVTVDLFHLCLLHHKHNEFPEALSQLSKHRRDAGQIK